MKTLTLVLLVLLTANACGQPAKVKDKGGAVRIKDKSKPVRAALEAQYAKIAQAYYDDDPEPVRTLRTGNFSVQLPDGSRHSKEQTEGYLKASFEQVQRTLHVSFDIDTIEVHGDTAAAEIHQQWRREQNKAGQLRTVETEAHQREWWLNTSQGWRLFFIDNVRPGVWKVDGKRIDPSKPYDPEAAPYDPDEGQ